MTITSNWPGITINLHQASVYISDFYLGRPAYRGWGGFGISYTAGQGEGGRSEIRDFGGRPM